MALLTPTQRLAIKKLKSHELVKKLEYNFYKARVTFTSGITENWVLKTNEIHPGRYRFAFDFPKDKLFVHEIPIYAEFEAQPLDEDEARFLRPFFVAQDRDIKKAGFCDIRLIVHKVITRILAEGWIKLKYPKKLIEEDLAKLRRCDSNRFFVGSGKMSAFVKYDTGYAAGRIILEHFLDWGTYVNGRLAVADCWNSPSHLHASIQSIMRSNKDITRSNIVRHFGLSEGRRNAGPRYINPWVYYSIIKSFMPKHRTIFDLVPGLGSKMLAASLTGSTYVSDISDGLEEAASFVSCKLGDTENKYDVSILTDLDPIDAKEAIEILPEYLEKSIHVLLLVRREESDIVKKSFKPRRIVKIAMHPIDKADHHFFIY